MAEQYVVRGAKMRCNCGSHARKINLPVSHGSYVNGHPMMNEGDCKPVENITYFGICQTGKSPSSETIFLIDENGATISGKPCIPTPIGPWTRTKTNTKVEGQGALTTESQLFCEFNGTITFVSDGQQGE